ncbi:hypothetical protein S7711_06987 [Stachybotrys chartarum IBT 7711]|uniref:J domain-containing protein n=1 Tax=Stachybotrys chartarum (strain CBS 109288 / IBT 7711) TaxID=1280523 RepID=A0A084AYA5_STACB|nr:hypothetical protein S7711_06987 [Stachybotrys chartarum IBT 7711]KFA47598.1 hypothetical protein S40293_07403 [Stachybotrys chartarum IBT 40293]KFA79406.1 hypothetical protein S40288_06070 [Stachybotrys chartarum IBT 40288]
MLAQVAKTRVLVTSWAQSIYYGITIRAGDPKPAPGSARFKEHRRLIHILVITCYLLYTIYEADYDLRRNSSFYADLDVPVSAGEREIKSRYRRLAAQHHPDKGGNTGADFFIHLKLASDTLLDASKRFAYERFGPAVSQWQQCTTIKDYVSRGVLQGIIPHYVLAAATIYVLGIFGYMTYGRFYRWIILIILCTFEFQAVTRPDFPVILNIFNAVVTRVSYHPPFLPFQAIQMARQLSITSYIALTQIAPLLAMGTDYELPDDQADMKVLQQKLQRLEGLAGSLDTDVARLIDMELAPYKGDPEAVSNLQGKMREWLVQNTVRADPMVKDALGTSFRRRRIDAPAGAKGNR